MIRNRFTHLCVVIDALADVWVEELIKVSIITFFVDGRANVVVKTLSGV